MMVENQAEFWELQNNDGRNSQNTVAEYIQEGLVVGMIHGRLESR